MKTHIAIKYVEQHGFNATETTDGAILVEIPYTVKGIEGVAGYYITRCTTFREVQIALGY